jgi:hypothetical protein
MEMSANFIIIIIMNFLFRSLRPGFGFSSLILVVTKAFAPSMGKRLHKMRHAAYT